MQHGTETGTVPAAPASRAAGAVAVILWGAIERTYAGWVGVALHVSLFYPGVNMAIFTALNIMIHNTGTTGAVPVGMCARERGRGRRSE